MNIPEIQEWQLQRLLTRIGRPDVKIPGLKIIGFMITAQGVDEITFQGAHILKAKPLDEKLITFYRDAWFTLPHFVLAVHYAEKSLFTAFWSFDMPRLKAYIQEMIPDVDTSAVAERPLSRPTQMGTVVQADPRGQSADDLPPPPEGSRR